MRMSDVDAEALVLGALVEIGDPEGVAPAKVDDQLRAWGDERLRSLEVREALGRLGVKKLTQLENGRWRVTAAGMQAAGKL